jgi:hypothetical protein
MRQYLLTEQERQIIKKYLQTGDRLEGFKVLIHRCRHMETVQEDLNLIKQLLEKADSAPDEL